MVRIFFQHDVDRTAHRRTAELGRNDALVDFDPVDHVYWDVIQVDEVRLVIHRCLVNEEADPFSFKATYGQPGGAADSSRGTHGHPDSLRQDSLHVAHSSLELFHADYGYGHCLFAHLSRLAFSEDYGLCQRKRLGLHIEIYLRGLAGRHCDFLRLGNISHVIHAYSVGRGLQP